MTKLQQIKNVIAEAVPEILELKFGCEILRTNYDYDTVFATGEDNELYTVDHPEGYDGEYEILGRPIQLADCLAAISERTTFDYKHIVRADGLMFDEEGNQATWNLLKPLDGQSEETINFLHGILVKDFIK